MPRFDTSFNFGANVKVKKPRFAVAMIRFPDHPPGVLTVRGRRKDP